MKLLSENLVKICNILSDLNFHDGDAIGKKLGITRSAVWKAIKKLEEYGVEVTSIKNKGYKLKENLLLLDKEKIIQELANYKLVIAVFETIDSTNNYLKKNIDYQKRKICIAETQTNARGRMGRFWHAPFGENLYFSYAYPFKKDISDLNGLSLVIGIASIAAIKEIGINYDLKLKWPNDGIYDAQKFMGNLVELQSEAHGDTLAIIGIGINVNMLACKEQITQNWTSLKKISNQYIDRNKLVISLIHNLNYYLEKFSQYGLKEFLTQWQELDFLYNKSVKLTDGEAGIARGVNLQGNLLVENNLNRIKAYSSGEVSILKSCLTIKN